jgi:hypothetical protein
MKGAGHQQRGIFSDIVGTASTQGSAVCARFARWLMWRCAIWPQFEAMYAKVGRPLIQSTKPLRALSSQVLYSVRSE